MGLAPKLWQPTMPPANIPGMLTDMPSLAVQPKHSVAAYIPPGFKLVPMDQAPARKPNFANRQAQKFGKGGGKGKGKKHAKGGKGTKSMHEVAKGSGKLKGKGDGKKGKGKKGKGKSMKGKPNTKPAVLEDATLEESPIIPTPNASAPSKKTKKAAKKEKLHLPGSPADMHEWVALATAKAMHSSENPWMTRKGKTRVKNVARDLYIQHGSGKTKPDDPKIVTAVMAIVVKEEAWWRTQQKKAKAAPPKDVAPIAAPATSATVEPIAPMVDPAAVSTNSWPIAAVAAPAGVNANSTEDATMGVPAEDAAENSSSSDEEKPPAESKVAKVPIPGRSSTWVAEIPLTVQEKQDALNELNYLTNAISSRVVTRSEFIRTIWNIQGVVFTNRFNANLLQVTQENEQVYAASVACQEHAEKIAKDVDKAATVIEVAEIAATSPAIAPVTPVKTEQKN
jgi:hypothetical protein